MSNSIFGNISYNKMYGKMKKKVEIYPKIAENEQQTSRQSQIGAFSANKLKKKKKDDTPELYNADSDCDHDEDTSQSVREAKSDTRIFLRQS